MTPARTLMIQGTASGVGKSLLVAALCRVFARRGLSVAPFKAQNMSNNAAVLPGGGEIGRAQALQARAAGVQPEARMNPILIKPLGAKRSEVIVLGRRDEESTAAPWRARKPRLRPVVLEALEELRTGRDLVIVEGAGSPAEINLRPGDLVNMGLARAAGVPVLLAADIDRGGAFAALYGTWALLEPADRRHVRGFVLNRFRGDPDLLAPAPRILEGRTGISTLGVVPYVPHLLPEEDAAVLEPGRRDRQATEEPHCRSRIRIAAIHLPHLSNFDDLDPLAAEPGVEVEWVRSPGELNDADAIVLPGSRNTGADLRWLREQGLADATREAAARGLPIAGICGGYQMLGHELADPDSVEAGGTEKGLGLLGVRTRLLPGKSTRRTHARIRRGPHLFRAMEDQELSGYEIHHGETVPITGVQNAPGDEEVEVEWLGAEESPLGRARGTIWGSYLHGIFANDEFRAFWLRSLGLRPGVPNGAAAASWDARLEEEIDRVADAVERALDPGHLLRIAEEGVPCASG